MAEKNCNACEQLKDKSYDFVQNGVTGTVCNSLKNDTGFSPSNGNNDCTDLDYANDCLIGNMEDEVVDYEICDWKDFMQKFIHNLWEVIKAMICAICGIWTNIHSLWNEVNALKEQVQNILKQLNALNDKVNKLDCTVKFLTRGNTFRIGEDESEGSYVVAGKGVSYLTRSDGDFQSSDINLVYIGGGLGRLSGSLEFFTKNWQEPKEIKCWNYDDGGVNPRYSYNRKSNKYWNDKTYSGSTAGGNELIYEIRIKKSQYPQIRRIIGGFGQESNADAFHVTVTVRDEGTWASGQHGSCNDDGTARDLGDKFGTSDPGHKVPAGWIYVQLRMSTIWELVSGTDNSSKPTPFAWVGMRFNQDDIEC